MIILLRILFLLFFYHGAVMAKDFSQEKEPQRIIDIIPSLEILRYLADDKDLPILKSPLEAKLMASSDEQNIIFEIILSNNQDYEWFLNSYTKTIFSIVDEQGNGLMSYPQPKANPHGRSDSMHITDGLFRLIEPNERVELKKHIPARLFYENWKGKNVMVRYVNSGMPPSIIDAIREKYPLRYRTVTSTNRVMINCYDHDDKKGYLCKIDALDD